MAYALADHSYLQFTNYYGGLGDLTLGKVVPFHGRTWELIFNDGGLLVVGC